MSPALGLLLAVLSIWDCPARFPAQGTRRLPSAADDLPVSVDATGATGRLLALGEQNFSWDFETGTFVAKLRLEPGSSGPSAGDLYMNRDGRHSLLKVADFPGLTPVILDEDGRRRGMDRGLPNMFFPRPVFGNASLAVTQGRYWRSLSRAMLTTRRDQLERMTRFYLSNQVWVFPSNADTAPVGTNGDLFASVSPCWLTTAGRSWSDLPYLRAALEASRSLAPEVKAEIVRRGLLAPTVMTLLRKSLPGVSSEDAYLTAKAHPTVLPPNGANTNRVKVVAAALTVDALPPLVTVSVQAEKPSVAPKRSELTYATPFAWAYVLRAKDARRVFLIRACGAREFAFAQTHGGAADVTLERLSSDTAKVTVFRDGLRPTKRVDILVCGRNPGTGWGAPCYVSFARMDGAVPVSDPALTFPEDGP